jgi:hypothetical protein
LRALTPGAAYDVEIGRTLKDLAAEFDHRVLDHGRRP